MATGTRVHTIQRDPETGLLDRDEVVRTLLDLEAACHRLGGVIQAAPLREPVRGVGDDTEYETTGWLIVWELYGRKPRAEDSESVERGDEQVVAA